MIRIKSVSLPMHPTMPRALRRATQSKRVILHSLTLHPQQKPTRWTCLPPPHYKPNGGSVDFKMQHALTKVVFNVKSNDDITGKVITAFSITGAKAGHWLFMCRQTMTTRVSVGLIRQRLLPKHLPLPQNPCPYRIKVLRRKLCYVPTSCSPQI